MPDIITDVNIQELSLVYAKKDGKAYRPVNPDAVILATKAQEQPRTTLLGEFAAALTQKASGDDAAAEAQLQVAYTTILNTLYAATDDLYDIKYAPESFTNESKKAALKTVVDNFVKSISDMVPIVLKAYVVEPTPTIAQPPFQAPPGDHPERPPTDPPEAPIETPIIPDPPSEPTIAPAEQPKTESEPPPPENEGKAQPIDDVRALVTQLAETVKAQGDKLEATTKALEAKDAELAAAAVKADEAKAALSALVDGAITPTEGASAPREMQVDSGTLNGRIPDFKSMAMPGSSGALETAIMTQLLTRQSTP